MSGVGAAAARIEELVAKRVAGVAAFRATVTAVDGSLVKIRRVGQATGSDEQYASLSRFALYAGDVVLCLPLGKKPVIVDVIRRAAAATPGLTALAAAGTGATVAIAGRDDAMQVQVVAGTAPATGSILTVTFAAALPGSSYDVLVAPNSSAARSLGGVVGPTSRGSGGFDLATATALTAGSTYQWGLVVRQYG